MSVFDAIERLYQAGKIKKKGGLTLLENGEFTSFSYDPKFKNEKELFEFYEKNKSDIEKQESEKERILIEKQKISDKKIKGFEFNGVMCSATSEDHIGLIAISNSFRVKGRKFEPTQFRFKNGSSLILDKSNFAKFENEFIDFRNQFFGVDK